MDMNSKVNITISIGIPGPHTIMYEITSACMGTRRSRAHNLKNEAISQYGCIQVSTTRLDHPRDKGKGTRLHVPKKKRNGVIKARGCTDGRP